MRSGPIVSGDFWEGREIIGFAFTAIDGEVADVEDVLLLAGDERAARLPTRAVPIDSAVRGVNAKGDLPPRRLAANEVIAANGSYAYIAQEFRDWPGSNPEMARVATGLCQSFDRLGHVIWLAGGAARDVVAGWGVGSINDLDLTGTAPVGAFLRAAIDWLVGAGLGDLRVKMNTGSMVCSATNPRDEARLFEYKPLVLVGCNFLASDGDLKMDSETRDLRFNCLFYDPVRELLLDPTGQAIDDIRGRPIKFVVASKATDPEAQAGLILRALKFMVRYESLGYDTTAAEAWVRSLPAGLVNLVAAKKLKGLQAKRIDWLKGLGPEDQMELAERLGPAAEELLRRLDTVK
ncbi:MAG TPA: hypothetical protein VMT37_09925 [Solirubrobacterales bacterium]|nr:hypothetical protein [Solirubrobacterales bacterium]